MKNTKSLVEKTLSGQWLIALDEKNIGREDGWFNGEQPQAVTAVFPGFIQDTFKEFVSGVAWYWHKFTLDELPSEYDAFLKLGDTNYITEAWINGVYLGKNYGRFLYYDFLCTDALKQGENLVALRIVAPGDEEIDGFTFKESSDPWGTPDVASSGGICYDVRISFRNKVRTDNAVVRADMHTGSVEVDTALYNGKVDEINAVLCAQVLSPFGETVVAEEYTVTMQQGETKKQLKFSVTDPMLWDTFEPNLYTLNLMLTVDGKVVNTYPVVFGFREFTVKDGWFHLNGKRRFFKAINVMDGWHGMGALMNNKMLYKELCHLKSIGFDSIRFHNYVARPEIFDMCDKIGIAVIAAHGASWVLKKQNRFMEEIFHHHLLNTVRQTINHPSILAWELVNESHNEREIAVRALPVLREVDMTRLVFLGSGRWDNEMSIGSISNPFSMEWECVWGAEDPNAPPADHAVHSIRYTEELGSWNWGEDDLCCWEPQLGDVHIYARIPLTFRGKYAFRCHGKNLKPAFLSEAGANSMSDALSLTRRIEQEHFVPNSSHTKNILLCAEFFEKEWERYGLGDVYPFIEDMVMAGNRQCAQTKILQFECIRSNPQFAGISYSCLSGPASAFGLLNWFRERQPYIAEAVTECLADLRWCVFIEPENAYCGKPFTVEAVLASNDVLSPGSYPVCARIQHEDLGCIWEYRTVLEVKDPGDGYMPFAFPVFKEEVTLDVPAGKYNLSVYLEKGGAASGGQKVFYLSEQENFAGKSAELVGLDETTEKWLAEHGLQNSSESNVVLVGDMPDEDSAWAALYEKAEKGATVVFLKPEAFMAGVENPYEYDVKTEITRLPFEWKGKLQFADNWAYRVHTILKKHKYSEGLPLGVLDDQIYNQTEPMFVFRDMELPEEIVAMTIAPLYVGKNDNEVWGSLSGLALGAYHYGKGKIVINAFRILNELGKNPAAGKLLKNFL